MLCAFLATSRALPLSSSTSYGGAIRVERSKSFRREYRTPANGRMSATVGASEVKAGEDNRTKPGEKPPAAIGSRVVVRSGRPETAHSVSLFFVHEWTLIF